VATVRKAAQHGIQLPLWNGAARIGSTTPSRQRLYMIRSTPSSLTGTGRRLWGQTYEFRCIGGRSRTLAILVRSKTTKNILNHNLTATKRFVGTLISEETGGPLSPFGQPRFVFFLKLLGASAFVFVLVWDLLIARIFF